MQRNSSYCGVAEKRANYLAHLGHGVAQKALAGEIIFGRSRRNYSAQEKK
jgi:hypothetical protein